VTSSIEVKIERLKILVTTKKVDKCDVERKASDNINTMGLNIRQERFELLKALWQV